MIISRYTNEYLYPGNLFIANWLEYLNNDYYAHENEVYEFVNDYFTSEIDDGHEYWDIYSRGVCDHWSSK